MIDPDAAPDADGGLGVTVKEGACVTEPGAEAPDCLLPMPATEEDGPDAAGAADEVLATAVVAAGKAEDTGVPNNDFCPAVALDSVPNKGG